VKRLNESTGAQVRVRIDAGFTDNDTLEALEERNIEYLGRLRSHKGLQKLAAPYLKRPRGRPPEQTREWSHDLEYQAGSWPAPRRVVLVVQERPDDLLLSLYAYQVLHGLRCLLERQTRQGWSLSRLREQVLKTAATLSLHARRITVHLGAAADKWWPALLKGLPKLTALS